ncbi:sigma-70 family RNA polymerase sigma factor [Fodinicola acaciae]|uniref:sigma-70 family RNA polymerase sigma factor n=1 Tax=Fodinicola acaciae TaxID=2681555 RepID=UPI001C9E958D|nr:sigma-70 family RNA polymerase sigma factor [Fodinicola acaciae]
MTYAMADGEPAVASGGEVARRLEEIYRATYQRLVLAAYALTGDLPEAQDAVQEAFLKAIARPAKALAADSPEAWLRTVALNVARSRFRRRVRLDTLIRREPPPTTLPGIGSERLEIMAAMRKLPAVQAEAIALHHLADLSVEEVARTLRTSANTIKTRLVRGRAALARLLDDDTFAALDGEEVAR